MRAQQRKAKKKKTTRREAPAPAKKTTRRDVEAPAPVVIQPPTATISNEAARTLKRKAEAAFERLERAAVTWSRGKLPGDVYIKTNSATGEFVVISREEWELLGR